MLEWRLAHILGLSRRKLCGLSLMGVTNNSSVSVSVNVLAFVQIWPLRLSRMTAHCNRHMGSIYPSNAHLEGRGGRRGNFRYCCLDPTYSLSSQ